jgi:predicted exporter
MMRTALRSPALWAWLGLMLLGAWLAHHARYVADLSAFLPTNPTAEQRVLLEQLKRGAGARALLVGVRGGDAAQRAEASRTLAAALRASGRFDAVHNGDNRDSAAVGEFLFAHRYLLSPAVDAQRFTVEGLRDAIDETVSLLGTPAGNLIKPLIWRDPTGETVRMAEAMLPAGAPRMDNGVWVSRTEPRAVLLASTRAEGADLDAQAAAVAVVQQSFAPLAAQGLTLELMGPSLFAVESRRVIEHEVERLAIWGTLIMIGMLVLSFGSVRALGIAMLPVASGVLAGIAAVSLGFGQVHGMTLGFGTTLLGEAVDYAIYYLIQARAPATGSGARGEGFRHWLATSWPTVRLGLWTSVAGFTALVFSGFGGLAQLGVFSVAGLTAAALTTRYLLPLLAPDGAPGKGLRRTFGRITARAIAILPRARWVFGALALAGLVSLVALPSAWRGSLAALSPVSPQGLQLDASLRNDLGASDEGVLVAVEAADEAAVLRLAEQAGQRLDVLVEQGQLSGYDSPARLLPSIETQKARQAALPDAATLRDRLAQATANGPLPAAKLGAFIDEVQAQRSAEPIGRARLAGTPLDAALKAQLLPGENGRPWTALLNLHASPGMDIARVRSALADLPTARVVRIETELNAMYARYLHEAFWQTSLGMVAVLLLLLWHLRSLRHLLQVTLPLAASVVLVLAGLTWAGVSLGLLHLVGLLLVVAVGSNYTLFFHQLRQAGHADDDTLSSLLIANVTLVASFALLCTSSVPVLVALGQAVAPGALLSLVLSAAFSTRPRKAS